MNTEQSPDITGTLCPERRPHDAHRIIGSFRGSCPGIESASYASTQIAAIDLLDAKKYIGRNISFNLRGDDCAGVLAKVQSARGKVEIRFDTDYVSYYLEDDHQVFVGPDPMTTTAPVHRAHPTTSGPYCVAYANLPAGQDPTTGQTSTFVRDDVTCPACVATYAPEWWDRMAAAGRARRLLRAAVDHAQAEFDRPDGVDDLQYLVERLMETMTLAEEILTPAPEGDPYAQEYARRAAVVDTNGDPR